MTPAEGSDLHMVVRPLGRGRIDALYVIIHRSSALRALTCAYLTRTSAEVLIPIIRRLPRGRRDFLSVVAPLQTSLSSLGFGRLACGW